MVRSAALLAVALVAVACGSSKTAEPEPRAAPVKQYLVYEKLVGEKGVWIGDADGSNPRLLVHRGHSPVISPDGESVAYVGGCNAEDVCKGTYIVSTSGGMPRRVSSDTPSARRAAFVWSPDSKRLVVFRERTPSKQELVSIDVADGREATLAKGYFYGVSFSPDGKQIVFAKATGPNTSYADGTYDLFVAKSDGGDPKQITNTGRSVAPVWGPKSIAFSRIVWGGEWGRNEIWGVQPDGSERKTITGSLLERLRGTSGYDGLVPVGWADDGRALLGGMLTSAGAQPFAIDPQSGKLRALANDAEFVDAVGISHDGRSVLADTYPPMGGASEESATVLIVPYAGGKSTVVARGAGSPSWNR